MVSSYLKCLYEVNNGNQEFSMVIEQIKNKLDTYQMPEVIYFLDVFISSYEMTLDDLLRSE